MKEKLKALLREKPYFLLLLPMFFILHGYNAFFSFFPLGFVLLNLAITLIVSVLLYLVSLLLLSNKREAAILSFWVLLFFLSFGFLHDSLKKNIDSPFLISYKFILPFSFILFIGLWLFIRKRQSMFFRLFYFLNLLFILFIGYEIINAVTNYIAYTNNTHLLDSRFEAYKNAKKISIPNSSKPDIYFLVFDALPSTAAMQEAWGFNNRQLDSFLHKEKFYVAANSKSNYNLTVLSVSSTLNMDYTPPVDLYQDETKMYFKGSASLLDNSLIRYLNETGYDIKQYQPVSFVNKDWGGRLFFPDMLYMNYFYQTLPGRVYRDLSWNFSQVKTKLTKKQDFSDYQKQNKRHRDDLLHTTLLVKNSCSINKPKPQFVYAHYQLPHDPYIYDSTGNLKPAAKTVSYTEEEQPAAFIEQVKFANKIIQQLVTHIRQKNKPNTIIIIEGDHGFRNIYGKRGYMIYDNFSSFYFPDKDYSTLYQGISPVNSFRVVLNKFFDTKLPLLKDSSIFIPYTLPREKE
ncbi:MAG: sulfatase-like hydrolase/transferase [Lacibacter sp.]|nr:sulfatase-like hydrolase/transferase [Lacibacter sp.]